MPVSHAHVEGRFSPRLGFSGFPVEYHALRVRAVPQLRQHLGRPVAVEIVFEADTPARIVA